MQEVVAEKMKQNPEDKDKPSHAYGLSGFNGDQTTWRRWIQHQISHQVAQV